MVDHCLAMMVIAQTSRVVSYTLLSRSKVPITEEEYKLNDSSSFQFIDIPTRMKIQTVVHIRYHNVHDIAFSVQRI